MILSSIRQDSFIFDMPTDIIPDDILEAYNKQFVYQPSQLITSMTDLMHDSISKIEIKGMNGPITSQDMRVAIDANGVPHSTPQFQRGAASVHSAIDKRIEITMRHNNGALYFSLLQSYMRYWDDKSTNPAFQPMRFTALYANKPIYKISFIDVIWASISGLSYDAASVDNSEKTFSMTFVYNNIEFKLPTEISKE